MGVIVTGITDIAERIQKQLSVIYEIETPHSVGEYLISDRELVDALEQGQPGTRDVQEKLLVRQAGDDLDLALYVDSGVAGRLTESDPTEHLTSDNLQDYLVLLEGVSHFVYLTWKAQRERPVTLLELELQAEVDKFVSTVFWMGAQSNGHVPQRLGAILFDDVDFDEQLDADGRDRYETANRVAAKYCRTLEQRFLASHRVRDLVDDVRRFYRLPREEKLRAG